MYKFNVISYLVINLVYSHNCCGWFCLHKYCVIAMIYVTMTKEEWNERLENGDNYTLKH